MKIKSTLFAFGILLALSHCGEEDPSFENDVTRNGASFKITAAKLSAIAKSGKGQATITFIHEASGRTVKKLQIEIEYDGDSNVDGSYSFPQQPGDKAMIDYFTYFSHTNQEKHVSSASLASGWVTIVNHSDITYTVEMELTMDDGSVFSGSYKGKFGVYFVNQ